MKILEVIRRPVVTEKSTVLASTNNQYVFEVDKNANKLQIKEAVEMAFDVNVIAVNTLTVPGKMRRVGKNRGMTSPWKKAIVSVQHGQKIELFEGV
jgi:large subunit ribosomal protein L23